jgi:hypothetical protein
VINYYEHQNKDKALGGFRVKSEVTMTDLLEQAIAKVKQLPESEQDNIAQIILKELETKAVDFWDEFDEILEECQVSTGIKDLSYQHDHYIHGTPKREEAS